MASFRFSQDEYVSACMGMAKKRILRFVILLFVAFGLLAFSQSAGSENPARIAGYFAAGYVTAVFFFVWLRRRRLRKAFESSASFQEQIEIRMDDDGIHYTHETGAHVLLWDRVTKWSENVRFFYLYESDLFARILPKRALEAGEQDEIRGRMAHARKV